MPRSFFRVARESTRGNARGCLCYVQRASLSSYCSTGFGGMGCIPPITKHPCSHILMLPLPPTSRFGQ